MAEERALTLPSVASEIDRYLRTGDSDVRHAAWTGDSFLARAQNAHQDLREALVTAVRRASTDASVPQLPTPSETSALTRRKVEPMVRGLFPRAEQDRVLSLVEGSVVFLTPHSIEGALRAESFDRDAWDLANLYLGSIGASLLGLNAPRIVGLSLETTCYVSPVYFEEDDPFADFVVHEVAHIFHNCKREQVGLPFTRRREWLLEIAFRKRETFAYACEAFSRVVAKARGPEDRAKLAAEFAGYGTSDGVDAEEVADIVREAARRWNGWKVILGRCAPSRRA